MSIPSYHKTEFFQRSTDYCICVFVLNEGERFKKQIKGMESYAKYVDIIVVDGQSTDGCTDPKWLKSHNVNSLLIKTGTGKLGTQMRIGFHWALERGYKGIICIDGNGKDDFRAIPDFITKLNEGYDHVQGSRFIEGGSHQNTPMIRFLAIKLLHAPLIKFASGSSFTDTTNGFRAYSKNLLLNKKIDVFRSVFTSYELHYYLAVRAGQLKLKCCETPVTRSYPNKGPTPTKINSVWGYAIVLIKLIAVCLGHYNTKNTQE